MITDKNLELLDNYVGNRMGVDEKAAFEKQLNTDPELQQEFQLQQKIADSLREARVSELKTMLNNVPAAALKGSNVSVVMKLAIGAMATAIVATGLYFYFEQPQEAKVEVVVAEEAKPQTSEPIETTETQPEAEPQIQSTNAEEKKIEKIQHQKIKKATKPAITVTKPSIDVFDPAVESDSQSVPPVSEKVSVEKPSHSSSIVLGIDKGNKKYTFNYQFKDDSLLLFGPFEKNVYEIMEFFSEDNKRTIFLFYKDHYYFLKEDGEKIKPLKAISDPTLIKKLKDSRRK